MQAKQLLQPLAMATLLAIAAPSFAASSLTPLRGAEMPQVRGTGNNTWQPSTAVTLLSFDVAGIESRHGWGDPGNAVYSVNIGSGWKVVSAGWDVNVTAVDPSWLSEMAVDFTDSAITTGVSLHVGVNDSFSGTTSYSSGGQIDLVGLGLAFRVGSDGNLRLEFSEDFDDSSVNPDGFWNSGSLTFGVVAVPEPGTYGLMALGLLAVGAAARRRSA